MNEELPPDWQDYPSLYNILDNRGFSCPDHGIIVSAIWHGRYIRTRIERRTYTDAISCTGNRRRDRPRSRRQWRLERDVP